MYLKKIKQKKKENELQLWGYLQYDLWTWTFCIYKKETNKE